MGKRDRIKRAPSHSNSKIKLSINELKEIVAATSHSDGEVLIENSVEGSSEEDPERVLGALLDSCEVAKARRTKDADQGATTTSNEGVLVEGADGGTNGDGTALKASFVDVHKVQENAAIQTLIPGFIPYVPIQPKWYEDMQARLHSYKSRFASTSELKLVPNDPISDANQGTEIEGSNGEARSEIGAGSKYQSQDTKKELVVHYEEQVLHEAPVHTNSNRFADLHARIEAINSKFTTKEATGHTQNDIQANVISDPNGGHSQGAVCISIPNEPNKFENFLMEVLQAEKEGSASSSMGPGSCTPLQLPCELGFPTGNLASSGGRGTVSFEFPPSKDRIIPPFDLKNHQVRNPMQFAESGALAPTAVHSNGAVPCIMTSCQVNAADCPDSHLLVVQRHTQAHNRDGAADVSGQPFVHDLAAPLPSVLGSFSSGNSVATISKPREKADHDHMGPIPQVQGTINALDYQHDKPDFMESNLKESNLAAGQSHVEAVGFIGECPASIGSQVGINASSAHGMAVSGGARPVDISLLKGGDNSGHARRPAAHASQLPKLHVTQGKGDTPNVHGPRLGGYTVWCGAGSEFVAHTQGPVSDGQGKGHFEPQFLTNMGSTTIATQAEKVTVLDSSEISQNVGGTVVCKYDIPSAQVDTKKTFAGLFQSPHAESIYVSSAPRNPTTRVDLPSCGPDIIESEPEFPLEFIAHGPRLDNLILQIPKSITEEGEKDWVNTLVGYFVGRNLPYSLVTSATKKLWANVGIFDTLATDSGFFFFTFPSEEKKKEVLEGGPWYIAGQPLVLQPWKPSLKLDKQDVHSIPIWIHLYGIPLELWTPKGISFIASFIGKPLRVDRMTASRRRISYARVCVEVKGDLDLIEKFSIETEDGVGDTTLLDIDVEYQWKPARCSTCSTFGHDCNRVVKQCPAPGAQKLFPAQSGHPAIKRKSSNTTKTGVWQVVHRKDKGKKIVEGPYLDVSPRGSLPQIVATSRGTSQENQVFDSKSNPLPEGCGASSSEHVVYSINDSPPLCENRTANIQINNSFNGLIPYVYDREDNVPIDVFVGDPPNEGIPELDATIEDSKEIEDEAAFPSPISARQRKRVAKMLFSGSRPKGRHRL